VDHAPRSRKETAQYSAKGNRYLRVLFVQAAWVVLIKPQTWEALRARAMDFSREGATASHRARIALANKLARIAWAILGKEGGESSR
jgi:transposase